MRKMIVSCALALSVLLSSQQAHAIKPFGDVFKTQYADESKNEDFKKLVTAANCNVCHVKGENKKVRNPYGEAANTAGLEKKKFDALIKSDKAKALAEIGEILKKLEGEKEEGASKSFGEKIEAGELPGGDKDGKPVAGMSVDSRPVAAKLITFTAPVEDAEFVSLFDGKSLDGWKINENEDSWSIVDGAIVCQGDRSHLFYVGDDKPFKNFHFKAEVKTKPNANAGIYFHTKFQESGWPKHGFECQVNNSYDSDPRRTSSLYGVKDVNVAPAKDDVWYTQEIIVQDKKVTLKVDGKVIVEYVEPDDQKAGDDFTRKLDQGTFALQSHDPGSRAYFRNIQVKRLD